MIICFLAPKIDATSKVDLSKFVPKNVNKLTEEEVVDELVESILYNKGEDRSLFNVVEKSLSI